MLLDINIMFTMGKLKSRITKKRYPEPFIARFAIYDVISLSNSMFGNVVDRI
jgi:hypothetical protein